MNGQLDMNVVGKRTYSVTEIQEILGISRRMAYLLCNSGVFKTIKIGRVMRISKASFDSWLDDFQPAGGNIDGINSKAR